MVKADPTDLPGIVAVAAGLAFAGAANLQLHIGQRVMNASLCACAVMLRSAAIGAKAHAGENSLAAGYQRMA
jgi:hypothetical protein